MTCSPADLAAVTHQLALAAEFDAAPLIRAEINK